MLINHILPRKSQAVAWGLFITVAIGFAIFVNARFWEYETDKGTAGPQDIYFLWLEGGRILSGENPYERILSGNLLENDKYATHFPLFYLLSASTQLAGLRHYPEWISFWRYIFLFFNIGIVVILFFTHYRHKQIWLAIFATLFWSFNRWTLYVAGIAHVDFIPIFLLLLSLLILQEHKWTALFLFSLSLAIKHLAIFLVPLYLIWVWQISEKNTLKNILLAAVVITSIPALVSIPFVFWNAEAFLKSMLFSATREPAGLVPPSLDSILDVSGFPARLPLFSLMGLIYIGAMSKRIGKYTAVLATMFVIISFNPVVFPQYVSWIVPFVSLIALDTVSIPAEIRERHPFRRTAPQPTGAQSVISRQLLWALEPIITNGRKRWKTSTRYRHIRQRRDR